MINITTHYLSKAEIWLFLTTLVYFLMNGAQIFETAVIVPKWSTKAPESFLLFKGQYGLDFKVFWIVIHSIHEITFILAIVFCWKLVDIRNWLLILFAIHFAVRAWTLIYFAPNIIEFQRIANSEGIGNNLMNRANLWRTLNYIRVGIFVAVSIGHLPLCIRMLNFRGSCG